MGFAILRKGPRPKVHIAIRVFHPNEAMAMQAVVQIILPGGETEDRGRKGRKGYGATGRDFGDVDAKNRRRNEESKHRI